MARYALAKARSLGNAGRGKKAAKRPRPRKRGAVEQHGIQISVGPYDKEDLQFWVTFPVTPTVIPVQTAAEWVSTRLLHGGERIAFGGRNLDVVPFEGRLEPPLYYTHGSLRAGESPEAKEINDSLLNKLMNQAHISGAGAPFNIGGDNGVVMQEGAVAGQNYLEAQAFADLLTNIKDKGEVIRLIIGDDFGWNNPAVITEFTYRWEDVDPDVLLFNISFKEFRELEVQSATVSKHGAHVGRKRGNRKS
jgi:hypothetical protein